MSNVDKILNVARNWIGLKESNGSHMEIINVYNGHSPLARNYKVKSTDSWCATFVSACAIKAGLADIIPLECSCGNMITLAKNMGIWNEDDNITPNPGDIIMYDWDKKDGWPEHVGIVEAVSGNQITVIEGNKSDAVARRTIAVGNTSIRGYVQPKYSGATATQPSQPSTGNEATVDYYVKVNTPSGVNCRTDASQVASKITAYANGTELHVTKEKDGWLYVNNTGYVSGDYCVRIDGLSINNEVSVNYQVRVNTPSGVNCRKGPAIGSGKVTAYPNGTLLNITKESNGWLYANNQGWVYGEYCTRVGSPSSGKSTGTYEVTASDLIVRDGPDGNPVGYNGLTADAKNHDYDKDGCINQGTRVTVKEWSGNWARIPSGWVSGDYLKKV